MTISDETKNIYQRSWHYFGLWSLPSQPRHPRYTVYSIILNFTTHILFSVCLVLSLFVENSFDDKIETFLVASATITSTIKLMLFLISRRDIEQLINLMQLVETVCVNSPRERSCIIAAKRKSEFATSFFQYIAIFVIALIILNKLMQPKRSLMWCSLYPFDWQSNSIWYVIAMIFQVVCTVHAVMLTVYLDMWWAANVLMLAGFFDLLSGRLQRLGWSKMTNLKKSQLPSLDKNQNRLHEKELIDCVKYHLLCLRYLSTKKPGQVKMLINLFEIFNSFSVRYFRVLENCCNHQYFIQLSISSGVIGLTAYLLTTVRLFNMILNYLNLHL